MRPGWPSTVSYNTKELTALLLWSLYRVLEWESLDVVVVDNGSSDGSSELLAQAHDAGLCVLIANEANVHHGPALNQALSWLAGRRRPCTQWVWVLDSDCVVARPDALRKALSVVEGPDQALVGETGWDHWNQCETLGLYSLLIRPARVWRPAVTPFSSGGNPIHRMLISAKAAGLVARPFGFTADGYVIHRGRGSLAAVARRRSARTRSTHGRAITTNRISALSPAQRSGIANSWRPSAATSGPSRGAHWWPAACVKPGSPPGGHRPGLDMQNDAAGAP